MKKTETRTPKQSREWGVALGRTLAPGAVVALFGDLGAGKTTLIKGIAEGAAALSPREVSSPTFTYLNIYSGEKTVYHFDLYRLKQQNDFLELGFEEHLNAGGISLIEWPERIPDLLPPHTLRFEMTILSKTGRSIAIKEIN